MDCIKHIYPTLYFIIYIYYLYDPPFCCIYVYISIYPFIDTPFLLKNLFLALTPPRFPLLKKGTGVLYADGRKKADKPINAAAIDKSTRKIVILRGHFQHPKKGQKPPQMPIL